MFKPGSLVRFLLIQLLLLFLCSPLEANAAQQGNKSDDTLVFGFLPMLSTQKLVARFGPLVDFLSQKLGKTIRLETAPNYVEFVRRSDEDQRYDILFTAPHFYYLAQREAGYRVIVRVAAPEMRAIIVAPKAGEIKTLSDLRGKRISTPAQISLGTVLIRDKLQSAGLDPDNDVVLVATPSHNASLLTAYKGITDAAGLMIPPFKRAKPLVRNAMMIIATTRGTPHMPISVAPSLSEEQVNIIEKSLLGLSNTESGKALLKHLSWPGFAKSSPAEYDQLQWAVEQIKPD
jgi:phosphonate transport system substrate-binding protein